LCRLRLQSLDEYWKIGDFYEVSGKGQPSGCRQGRGRVCLQRRITGPAYLSRGVGW
jgi:hypothetical protein